MTMGRSIRWGILGTAKIARNLFLPSLREAGGDPAAVAGRDTDRTAQWAADNGIGRAVTGYQDLVDDPGIDAILIQTMLHVLSGGVIQTYRCRVGSVLSKSPRSVHPGAHRHR